MMLFFYVLGVIAVAVVEKKEERLNETLVVRPSLILFYSFSDPTNPQVWKVYQRAPLKENGEVTLSLSVTAYKPVLPLLTSYLS